MKKENRKAAQAQRAALRAKQERNRKIKKWCAILIPILAVIIIIVAIAVNSSSTDDTADTTTSTETASTLQTDSELTVEDGDTVNIDYVGSVDGVEFDGGSTGGLGTDLVIGSGSYIDDFEEQLIGAHPGDTVDVNVTFPEEYGVEELNGQDALFEVTINGIYE